MANQELISYISQQIERGVNQEDIKRALRENGWEDMQIEEGFHSAQQSSTAPQNKKEVFALEENTIGTNAKLPGVFKLLEETISLYKQKFRTITGVMGIYFAYQIIFYLIIYFAMDFISSSFGLLGSLTLFVLMLVSVVVVTWSNLALIISFIAPEHISVANAYKKGGKKILSYVWISFLVGIIVLGGLPFLIVPAVVFATWFAFAIYILVAEENVKGMNALLKSREYVRGYWWNVFGRLFLFSLIVAGIGAVLQLFFSILVGATIFLPGPVSQILFYIFLAVFMIINVFVLGPIAFIYPFLVYKNLKQVKGGEVIVPSPKKQKTILILMSIVGVLVGLSLMILPILLASFNGAGDLANDASVKSNFSAIRAQAEMFYDKNDNSYEKVCSGDATIASAIDSSEKATGNTVTCVGTKNAWATEVKLKREGYFCVDSLGVAVTTNKSSNLSEMKPSCDNNPL